MSINLILRSLLFSFKSRDSEEENTIFSLRIGPIQWLRVTEEPDDAIHVFFSSDQFFKFFGLFSDVLIGCCVSFLSSLPTFLSDLLHTLCGIKIWKKTLTKSIWTPFPCQRPLRDWTRWYLVGGISISTIHDQFSNQCSRGCCCWCTDCQGWNIKLYTILVFISSLIISNPFHFHTYYLLLTHQ